MSSDFYIVSVRSVRPAVPRDRILEDGVVNTLIQIFRNQSLAKYTVKYKCIHF